jgi:Flp pilus assembly protein TadD
MQVVSAFSRPQTVPPVPTSVPKRNLWILSSWRDLLLYVGTPVLLVPLFTLAQARWNPQDIYLFVGAFGATGHHLPGMIRAYGDRALFERFRWRFILAPIFLLVVCVAFTWWDLKGIVLIVFFWGVWHGMMQTYGFCRIYDAKTGSFAALTRRLDFALCATWFATAVLLSPQRLTDTLETYYASGGPFIQPWLLHGVQQVMIAAATVVTAVFLANFIWMWARGQRPNPVKLVLLGFSIAFWWYCNNWVLNILVGIALFEVFHDVQYLSIVWIYNRNRVEKDTSIGGFMRFVFRRSGSLLGLYVGLVLAYGSLGLLKEVQIDVVKRALTGLVAASGLLHFYYDGFIWKVRERSTREHLGLTGGATASATPASVLNLLPAWLGHGLKWVAVFIIPLGALWLGQTRSKMSETERTGWITSDLPNSARAHYKHGLALQDAHQLSQAREQFQQALAITPNAEEVRYSLAHVFLSEGRFTEAAAQLEQALQKGPRNADFHSDYGYVLERLGSKQQAAEELTTAVRLNPKSARSHYNLAMFLAGNDKPDQAMEEFQKCLHHNPKSSEAHYYLGRLYFLKGDLQNAKTHYLETARLDPTAPVHNSLGVVYMRLGEVSEAVAQFNEALRMHPDDADAAENLRFALSGGRAGGGSPR